MERGGREHFYPKDLGWALLACGRQEEARAAFKNVLRNHPDWSNGPPATADVDHWTAAYCLGLLAEQQYAECWRTDPDPEAEQHMAGFPWFHIGQLREIEGKREEAIAAYRKSVATGSVQDAHWTANFAAYRVGILTGTISPPVTTRPVTRRPSR